MLYPLLVGELPDDLVHVVPWLDLRSGEEGLALFDLGLDLLDSAIHACHDSCDDSADHFHVAGRERGADGGHGLILGILAE